MADQDPPALAYVELQGGAMIPFKSQHNCKICKSPDRLRIEQALASRRLPRRIAFDLMPDAEDKAITYYANNITRHITNGHMPNWAGPATPEKTRASKPFSLNILPKGTVLTEVERKKRARAKRYKMEPEDLDRIMVRAGGCCEICGSSEELHIDHDHSTGAVRGVLCPRCNQGLGQFKDNRDSLLRAVIYLNASMSDPNLFGVGLRS